MSSGPPTPQPGGGVSPKDQFVLFILAGIALPTFLTRLRGWITNIPSWLVDHHAIIPASGGPILAIPGCRGSGLDWPRLVIATGVLIALIAALASAIRRRVMRHRMEEAQ